MCSCSGCLWIFTSYFLWDKKAKRKGKIVIKCNCKKEMVYEFKELTNIGTKQKEAK